MKLPSALNISSVLALLSIFQLIQAASKSTNDTKTNVSKVEKKVKVNRELAIPLGHELAVRYPDLFTNTSKVIIKETIRQLQTHFDPLYAPQLFLNFISAHNLVGFETLIEMNFDPFEADKETKLNALSILESIHKKSHPQNKMLSILHKSFSETKNILGKNSYLIESIKTKYAARSESTVRMNSQVWNFSDGSNLLFQAIIGNNHLAVKEIINDPSKADKLNETWGKSEDGFCDNELEECYEIIPKGWTPVMLAVALGRNEILKTLVESEKFDLFAGHERLTPYLLITRLPIQERVTVLKLFSRADPKFEKYKNLKEVLKSKVEGFAPNFLRHFIAKIDPSVKIDTAEELFNAMVDLKTIKIAIMNLDSVNFEYFMDFLTPVSENLVERNAAEIWESMVEYAKTSPSTNEIRKKFSTLLRNKFRMNAITSNDRNKIPYINLIQNPNIDRRLILVVLESLNNINGCLFDDHCGANESFLISSIKAQNITLINEIIDNAQTLRLELNKNFLLKYPSETNNNEGYIHYLLRYIKVEDEGAGEDEGSGEDDKSSFEESKEEMPISSNSQKPKQKDLIAIIDKLLKLDPLCVNDMSGSFGKNEHKYSVKENDESIIDVTYSDINSNRWTPLMYAVFFRMDRVAEYLIKNGANLGPENEDIVCVNGICKLRVNTFNSAFQELMNSDSIKYRLEGQSSLNKAAANKIKLESIRKNSDILTNIFKKSLHEMLEI